MSTHNICFCREISKILCGYPLLSVAVLNVTVYGSFTRLEALVFEKWSSTDLTLLMSVLTPESDPYVASAC